MASRRFLVVVSGAKIYVAANPLRSNRRKRTKDNIATVRHRHLDFDIEGEARLTLLRTSDTVSTPMAVLSTSLGKYQRKFAFGNSEGYSAGKRDQHLHLGNS